MEFILFVIFILAGWFLINYVCAYILSPFWWSKGRIKRTCIYSLILSFPLAILLEWIFDDND